MIEKNHTTMMLHPTAAERLVIASVLNWNTAALTHQVVTSLRALTVPSGLRFHIVVVDNGSRPDDVAALEEALRPMLAHGVELLRQSENLGFAGGCNVVLELAAARGAEFVWLVNSDAQVPQQNTLALLLAYMGSHPECGAVSPQLCLPEAPHKTYFSGSYHDWTRRISVRVDEARCLAEEQERPFDMWVPGTALFLRQAALAQVGMLNEQYFAYYEDDDICTRLASGGWTCNVCHETAIWHEMPRAETDRPPYYFYLIQRNHLLFWYGNTPAAFRKLLLLRLLDQAFFDVNKLIRKGCHPHATASALGILDFLSRRYGPPDLKRPVPLWIQLLVKVFGVLQKNALSQFTMIKTESQ